MIDCINIDFDVHEYFIKFSTNQSNDGYDDVSLINFIFTSTPEFITNNACKNAMFSYLIDFHLFSFALANKYYIYSKEMLQFK